MEESCSKACNHEMGLEFYSPKQEYSAFNYDFMTDSCHLSRPGLENRSADGQDMLRPSAAWYSTLGSAIAEHLYGTLYYCLSANDHRLGVFATDDRVNARIDPRKHE